MVVQKNEVPNFQTVAPFFQGKDAYKLDKPSEFIETEGFEFFSESSDVERRAIDIGVWSGRHIPFLHRIVREQGQIFGIDLDHPITRLRLLEAEAKARLQGISAVFRPMELTSLLFHSDFFDFALCWRVLHNIISGELTVILQELHRVLKPNARLLIAVRATKEWMPTHPIPQLFTTYLHSGERQDLYFSQESLDTVFSRFFQIESTTLIEEDETIFDSDGKGCEYTNTYWALKLINRA